MVRTPRTVLLVGIVAIVTLSGCLTVGLGVDSSVQSDGTIERYEMQMNMSGQGYTMMKSLESMGTGNQSQSGFDDIEQDVENNVTSEFESVGDVETNVTETAERMVVTVVLHDAVPAEDGNITVSTEGDRLVYRDELLNRSFGDAGPSLDSDGAGDTDDAMEGGMGGMMEDMPEPELRLTYRLEMPGEIQDSNADAVEGDVARWNRTYTGDEMDDAGFTVEAESATGSGGMPGFGPVAAVAALAAIGLIGARRRH